jgi:thimet oligopeptidase
MMSVQQRMQMGVLVLVVIVCAWYIVHKKMHVFPPSSKETVMKKGSFKIPPFHSIQDAVQLFSRTAPDIAIETAHVIAQTKEALNELIAHNAQERTFANTAKALDTIVAFSQFSLFFAVMHALEMVSPDESVRTAAHEAVVALREFTVDEVSSNRSLYNALKEYAQLNATREQLSEKQWYYLNETIKSFEREGLNLPTSELELVKKVKKEIAALSLSFGANIAKDQSTFSATAQELEGLDAHFINALQKNEQGDYILGVDYPTYFMVMENCSVEQTRKKMFQAFMNRAYPVNDQVLREVIAKRDELAKLLGFSSYAALDLDDQMVKTPDHAQQFLDSLLMPVDKKVHEELERLKDSLPDSVTLTQEGKLKPWDLLFVKNQYKKDHFAIDERAIAEYFPMEKTVAGLLRIYEQFFSIRFKQVPLMKAWHETVLGIEVYDAHTDELLGYFLLDLYPRPYKYTHACFMDIIPATYDAEGKPNKMVALVLANFPHATAERPSLLERKYVDTFFHEFGHALHGLLGRTQMASFAGTNVKRDFVEMPSQMLEEWLWDKDILKMISSHYQTNEPLPDELIEKIVALKRFDSGIQAQTQIYYARLSLQMFHNGSHVDPYALSKQLSTSTRPAIYFDPETHMYANFGHLMEYGAKYYGYLWSKVFALDLFEQIKKEGLLNPVVGKRYVEEVIGQGGSKDPNELLEAFLGRKPSQEAFLRDLGLS